MDPNPPRQPVFNIPPVIVAVLAVLLGIHLVREALPDAGDAQVLSHFAFVPGRFTLSFNPEGVARHFASMSDDAGDSRAAARFFLGDGTAQPWTGLTYALLHGGWTHVGLNGIWLLAFGTPVARRFLVFLAAGSAAGAATHYALFPFDLNPLIGASAAVSGCMGAATRFIFPPGSRDEAVEAGLVTAVHRPAVSLVGLVRDRRAVTFLAAWFLTNLLTGLGSVSMRLTDAPIAWQAHIGGFALGLLCFPWFDPRPPRDAATPAPDQGGTMDQA